MLLLLGGENVSLMEDLFFLGRERLNGRFAQTLGSVQNLQGILLLNFQALQFSRLVLQLDFRLDGFHGATGEFELERSDGLVIVLDNFHLSGRLTGVNKNYMVGAVW